MVPIAYPESRLLEFVKNPTTWPSILKVEKKVGKKVEKIIEKKSGKKLASPQTSVGVGKMNA